VNCSRRAKRAGAAGLLSGAALLPLPGFGQLYTKGNYVVVAPDSSPAAVVRAAASVVPSPRQLRWQQLELTGFLHFGMNTFTNKEWGEGTESPTLFNPTALDARQWVKARKAGGIKQVFITAKHHDGSSLWPLKFTKHSVQSSPWKGGKGDAVKGVADACQKQGVGYSVYLSPWNRSSPYFGDSAKYNNYFVNQLTELLSNYGRIDEVWFDGANGEGLAAQSYPFDQRALQAGGRSGQQVISSGF
jgi:alpha-L-fucosidase